MQDGMIYLLQQVFEGNDFINKNYQMKLKEFGTKFRNQQRRISSLYNYQCRNDYFSIHHQRSIIINKESIIFYLIATFYALLKCIKTDKQTKR